MATHENVFILPLAQVVFPNMRMTCEIAPEDFAHLSEYVERPERSGPLHIGVVLKKPDGPHGAEWSTVGTWCKKASHSHNTTTINGREAKVVTLTLEGIARFQVKRFAQTSPYRTASIKLVEERDSEEKQPAVQELMKAVQLRVTELMNEGSRSGRSGGKGGSLDNAVGRNRFRWPPSASLTADMAAAGLSHLSMEERQEVLQMFDVKKRLQLVLDLVNKVFEVQRLSAEINARMQKRSEEELRETVLKRQLHDMQKEMRKLKKGGKAEADADGDAAGEDADEADVGGEDEDELMALREALRKAQLSPDAQKIAQRELRRLQNIQPHHPEYMVSRTYLETLANLPWAESTNSSLDLRMAHEVLEQDHYGLDKVKRRILEFLAVQKLRGDMHGPILCLHGPPGVGKTSLGRSVAKALGRKFHRIALGGVRDEAELRGHRRTYIGSMPGAIIQALMSMKVNNPVILLDEIDKLTRNAMFNPSGAMLELLDPEQNFTFKDHYLNTPFDLSKVLFLCTCNDLNAIDRPLLDRMEIIELSGYTSEEKMHIAETHLLPKQRRLHALERNGPGAGDHDGTAAAEQDADEAPAAELVADEAPPPREPRLVLTRAALTDIITKWTMESGVRSLERRIAQVCRWAALRLNGVEDERAHVGDAECLPDAEGRLVVDARHLPRIIGAETFEPDIAERLTVGVAMGLGVTSTGGQLLFVEATRSKGVGKLTVTGQLGDVMRESVSTAMSLLRSKIYYAVLAASGEARPCVRVGDSETMASVAPAPDLVGHHLEPASHRFQDVFQQVIAHASPSKDPFGADDIHVHFPAGAIPKDGPSAGVATTLALASLLLNRPVRSDTAVTGEITLRGHVLPVGGIRDKVLAAHRAGVRHILLPHGNRRHAKDELPASVMGDVDVHFVAHIDEALAWAFGDGVQEWAPEVGHAAGAPRPAPTLSSLSKL